MSIEDIRKFKAESNGELYLNPNQREILLKNLKNNIKMVYKDLCELEKLRDKIEEKDAINFVTNLVLIPKPTQEKYETVVKLTNLKIISPMSIRHNNRLTLLERIMFWRK